MGEIGNHLWQSTLFALAIAVLCLILRQHSPRLRYWLLLAASVKFLMPFSLFVTAGGQVHNPLATPVFTAVAVEQATAAFAPIDSSLPAPVRETSWPALAWLAGIVAVVTWRFTEWQKIHAIRRSALPMPLAFPVPALVTATALEPGIFGVFRPVLLLPQGILGNLTAAQRDAILAHEHCHPKYRDNLTAAIHMGVEALFWFHPLVWWIGVRLIAERERHCDESVIAAGNNARAYAQSIVTVCAQWVSSPLPCAAGVSGSDLNRRIIAIMRHRSSQRLTFRGKAALTAATLGALAVPFLIGALRAQTLPPTPKYRFEVASIRPSNAPDETNRLGPTPQGGLRAENVTVTQLIAMAFGLRPFLIVDAPGWASSQRFDVNATPDVAEQATSDTAGASRESARDRVRQRLQALLIDRFGLVVRTETRPMSAYKLVVAKGGHKLTAAQEQEGRRMESNPMMLRATAVDMKTLAYALTGILRLPVLEETKLSGMFNLNLQFADLRLQASPDAATGGSTDPTIFTAITQQLGLRLESTRAPVPVFVVERVQKPSEN